MMDGRCRDNSFYVYYKNALDEPGISKRFRSVRNITQEHSYFREEDFYEINVDITGMEYKLEAEIAEYFDNVNEYEIYAEGEKVDDYRKYILGIAKDTFCGNSQTYKQGLECEKIIENLKNWSGTSFDDGNTDYQRIISERRNEIYEKLKNGDTEQSFQIGGSSFTEKEWDKLLDEVDDITEEMREAMREEHQKRFEKVVDEKIVNITNLR